MKVLLSPEAELDFEAQVRWLSQQSPTAGRSAALRIVEVIDLLLDFPEVGKVVGPGVREKTVPFGRDGFVIRYRRSHRTLVVQRIFHSRQDRG